MIELRDQSTFLHKDRTLKRPILKEYFTSFELFTVALLLLRVISVIEEPILELDLFENSLL